MPENDFEKQVQQKMEELKMVPSEEVWQKVQAQIPAEKKKRRFIWLPFIFFTGFLIATYFLINPSKTSIVIQHPQTSNSQKAIAQNPPLNQHTTTINKQTIVVADTTFVATNDDNKLQYQKRQQALIENVFPDKKSNAVKNKDSQVFADKKLVEKKYNNKLGFYNKKQLPENTFFTVNEKHITDKKRLSYNAKIATTVSNEATEEEIGNIGKINTETKQEIIKPGDAKDDLTSAKKADTDSAAPQENIQTKEIALLKEDKQPIVITVDKKESKNKWKYSIVFAPGISYTGSTYFGNTTNTNYYVSSAFDNNGTSGIPTGSGSAGNLFVLPSSIKRGLAVNIGFAAARRLSQRIDLSAGIQYKYFSTSFSVGQLAQASPTGSYRGILYTRGNSSKYHSQYHFIELPVSFQSRIGKEKSHSFYGDMGIVFSQLFSTNSLQFSNQEGLYYSKNDLFNKTTIGLSAGFSINIIKNKNAPLLLGPAFYYSLTPIASAGLYANKHYSFIGLRLQKYLKRK